MRVRDFAVHHRIPTISAFNVLPQEVNVKTAKALGLTSPPALLQRADQVIE